MLIKLSIYNKYKDNKRTVTLNNFFNEVLVILSISFQLFALYIVILHIEDKFTVYKDYIII